MIPRIFRRLRRLTAILGIVLVIAVVAGFLVLDASVDRAVLPESLLADPRGERLQTPALLDRRGDPLAVLPNAEARECYPVELREISPWLRETTQLVEDRRFASHPGADPLAIAAAAWRNLQAGRVVSGGSTITQQLIKISGNPDGRRDLSTKMYEALAAMKLEREWSKDQVLEAYLNRLDYGNRRFGAEAAARAYFGKPAGDLTFSEALYLAGLPQSPTRLNPWRNPHEAEERYRRNVTSLADRGLLPDGVEPAVLLAWTPRVREEPPPYRAPHVAEMLRDRVGNRAVLHTTLDLRVQTMAETLLAQHLREVGARGVGDAALVVLDNRTGEVRALACDGRREHRAINSATTPRSAGSTLKPFLYAQAIDSRQFTAASLLPDTPDAVTLVYQDYDPQNYTGRFHGPVRLREALGNSLNVPAVVTLNRLGEREMFTRFQQWGLGFPGEFADYGAGFVIGNAPVRLLDLAAAYAGLARGGVCWEPRLTGDDPSTIRRVASPETCAIITDVLADPEARRMSFGNASPLNLTRRAAVKTGTSSGFRDGWCVGFTTDHTVAVWAGNLDGRPMDELLAVRAAAPLWAAMMNALLDSGDTPLPSPQESASLVRREIDTRTGLLPRAGDTAITEWFLPGTQPVVSAETWYDAEGRLVLPEEYAEWVAGSQNHLGAVVAEASLKITFPRDGAVFSVNPRLPDGQQMILPEATAEQVQWILNGQTLPDRSFPLQPGEWTLTAQAGDARETVRFRVE